MNYQIKETIIKENPLWRTGTIAGCKFEAKVYEEGSKFGIDDGRVSKLFIRDAAGRTILSYDRGWDVLPETDEHCALASALLEYYK